MERSLIQKIKLKDISPEFIYGCRWRYDDAGLIASLARDGLLFPAVLTDTLPRTVVSGHKRCLAARQLGWTEIFARVLPRDLPVKTVFRQALLSNWNQNLSDLDRLSAFEKAAGHFAFTEDELVQELLPVLGLAPHAHYVREYRALLGLAPEALKRLRAGVIPFRGASVLEGLNHTDQEDFSVLIADKVQFNSNQMQQAVEWLSDLLRTAKIPLKDWLEKHKLNEILNRPDWDRRCKADQFFQKIRTIRYPRLSEYEDLFREKGRGILSASDSIRIEPMPSFEEDGFTLHVKIRDPESYQSLLVLLRDQKEKLLSLL